MPFLLPTPNLSLSPSAKDKRDPSPPPECTPETLISWKRKLVPLAKKGGKERGDGPLESFSGGELGRGSQTDSGSGMTFFQEEENYLDGGKAR